MLARIDELEAVVRARHDGLDEALVRSIVAEIGRQFGTHMAAEDDVLFPAMAGAFPEACGTLEPLSSDHGELRALLAELSSMLASPPGRVRNERLGVVTRDFVDLLRLHIRREELVVFQVACRVLTERDVEELARRLREQREGGGAAPPSR